MAEGVAKERWNHTSQLLATLCEINRNPKRRRRPFTADEFHPFLRRQVKRGTPYTKQLLRAQAERWFAERRKPHEHHGEHEGGEPVFR